MASSTASMSLPDIIVVKKLEVRMIVGVDNWERVQAQPVTIDARVHTDVSMAGKSDHLPHSIHYGILVKQLEAHCAAHRYRSLEALAEGLAKVCLFVLHAPKVTLNVEKPRSLLHAASAGVQIARTRDDYMLADASPVPADLDAAAHNLDELRLVPSSTLALEDKVIVRDLIINTIIGVNPWEREDKQNVKLNLVIYSGLSRAKESLNSTVGVVDVVNRQHNYRTIVRSISAYVEASSYKTVESLATSIARVAVLQNKVEKIRVSVDKPSAIMFASSAGVEVERTRAFFEQEAALEEQRIRAHTRPDAAQVAAPTASPSSASIHTQIASALNGTSPRAASMSALDSESGWHVAAIALGSNVGDRAANIEAAVQALSEAADCKLVDTSFLYETAPMYVLDQPKFLNAACRIATKLSPHELLALTQAIEVKLGRDKTGVPDKGPRAVDLDILLYDHLEIDDAPRLVVPHPGIKEREFVLEPLKDILPDFEHPTYSRTMSQLLVMLQKSPDYVPSGIRKVLPIPSPSTRAAQPATDTKTWTWGSKTFVMGIINATPDSFSDGGDNLVAENAVRSAVKMVEQGADVLDVGGMSTAPNAVEVDAAEETARVVSVIRAMRTAGLNVPISVDTFRASVAEAALAAGADMINDVSGGERDPLMLEVARRARCPYILMHMRGDSKSMNGLTSYEGGDVVAGVRAELEVRLDRALRAGVRRWNIVLDPGIGFAKDSAGNLTLLRDLARLTQPEAVAQSNKGRGNAYSGAATPARDAPVGSPELSQRPCCSLVSFPMLIGVSRKKFLGHITGKQDPKQRVYATAAACTAAIAAGADVLRVHDVEQIRDVAVTSDAIYRS
ncbi:dihydropteroate synthase [Moesziomyces antarcticus]|uniref:Related to multifunctional folic acid synthesis protein n=1 Tax=Pseudozyma antarctica TaxID=84753 RepID=A0A5C3FGM1_PSEA2|nr:dihydropteroate synthase [Moesziomyces antarcticus]GAK63167.1 dihydropteroate synthase [Moesziomyces antarcticus]SPO43350.1 related to multifunctional folic acid synthesis protein [Moesziomyces antarcticus]